MKNLLNCHCKGVHSFPVSFENGLYRRIFYADIDHELWMPYKIAIHPHHVDIKITVLEGKMINAVYKVADENEQAYSFSKFLWNSHILNGNGGFELLGIERLVEVSCDTLKDGDSVTMKSEELHTVVIDKGHVCVWMVEEYKASSECAPLNYSIHDLTKWTPDGLYIEVDDSVKQQYIGKYLSELPMYCE